MPTVSPCHSTHSVKVGLPSSSSSWVGGVTARRGGVLTTGMNGERERDLDLRLRRAGLRDLDLDRELSVDGDLHRHIMNEGF